MTFDPKPGTGSLFRNEYHVDGDNKPNARGFIIAHRDIKAGERLELAAWTKQSGKGPFQSLRMSDPRPKKDEGGVPDLNDSIPY